MTLQALPSPFAIPGGDNPYYTAAGNIAGFAGPDNAGDYDRYLQAASPFLAGLGEASVFDNWPLATAAGAYGYIRAGKSPMGLLLGVLGGYYLPRATPILIALDAIFSHEGARSSFMSLASRR